MHARQVVPLRQRVCLARRRRTHDGQAADNASAKAAAAFADRAAREAA
jgi:hypothetical protein